MGELWDVLQSYIDRQDFPVSERQLALKLGLSTSNSFSQWRNLRRLPEAQNLVSISRVTGTPYHRVLDAALRDIGYLPEPEPADNVRSLPTAREVRAAKKAASQQIPRKAARKDED